MKRLAYTNPSQSDFSTFFFRDFPFGDDPNENVLPQDIQKAFVQTNAAINPGLFANQQDYNVGYFYLSAHFLVLNLRASSQGINGQFNFLQSAKGVGAVNESFSIPQRILDNPYWSIFTKSNYGMLYLNMVLPSLCGAMSVACGTTRA